MARGCIGLATATGTVRVLDMTDRQFDTTTRTDWSIAPVHLESIRNLPILTLEDAAGR